MAPCVAAPPARSAAASSELSVTSSRDAPAAFAPLYVHLNAVRTLRGEGDCQGNEFAILSGNSAVFADDDLIQVEPCIEVCGGELAHLLKKSQIADIMVVFAHFLLRA